MPFPLTPELSARVFVVLAAAVAFLLFLALVFALLALVLRILNDRRDRRWKALEERWEPRLLEILAEGEDGVDGAPRVEVASVMEEVAPGERLLFAEYLFEFARRVRGRELDVLRELARLFLPQIAARTRRRRGEDRARAVQILGALGLPQYEKELLGSLEDPSPLVAMIAAQSLTRAGRVKVLEQILGRLDRFGSWRRTYLAGMLAQTGPEAIPLLRSTLADREQIPTVRSVAAEALLQLPDPAAAEVAARVVQEEDDESILVPCLRLLARAGTGAHRGPVLGLVSSRHFAVRSQALRALGTLGEADDLTILEEGLHDPSPWVALEAARSLRKLGGTETLRSLASTEGPRAAVAREILAG